MKELSIEEKAKRYDEALKVANKYKDTYIMFPSIKDEIFPELKEESEDERIRKEMIFYFTEEIPQCSIQEHSDKMREFISWLERQEVERTKLKLKAGNSYFCYKSRWERADSETFKKGLIYKCNKDGVLDNFVIKNPEQHFIEIKDEHIAWLEKQGEKPADTDNKFIRMRETKPKDISEFLDRLTTVEQEFLWEHIAKIRELDKEERTPTDKVDPKFKVGDWVVQGNSLCQIEKVTDLPYNHFQYWTTDGHWFGDGTEVHLWSIQDAKDGDVLAIDPWSDYPSSFVAIYKKQNEEDFDNFDSYCFVGFDGKFYENEDGHSSEYIHPATKEQRDQLEKAMANAGYTFDFDKKELKKIEHKPAWSEEDERFYNQLNKLIYSAEYCRERQEKSNWLKSLKDRYTWKPSDLPHWKKSTLPNDNTTGFNSDYFCYKGYNINYKELFEKLPKDD